MESIRCLSWALMLLIASNLQAFFPLRPQLLEFWAVRNHARAA